MGQLTRRPRNSPEAILMLPFNPVSLAPFNPTQKLQNSAIGRPCPHSPAFFLRSIGPRMSLTPFGFGPRRSNIFDPFSLDLWDPFEGFPFDSNLSFPRIPFPTSSDAGAASAFAADTRIDWKETPEAHVFKADLPGLRKEEVKVEVEDGRVLQISGERSREHDEKTDTWHRVERSSGRFLRRFRLPENAKVEQVKAAMEDGVLTVTVPKEGVKKPNVKSIEISG